MATDLTLTERIAAEFDKGKWLTATEVAERFGCSKGMLHQVKLKLEDQGHDIEREVIEGGAVRFRLKKAPKAATASSNGNGSAPPAVAPVPVTPSPEPVAAAPQLADLPPLGAGLTVYGLLIDGRVLLQAEDGRRWEGTLAVV